MDFWNAFASLFSNFGNLTWQMVVMWGIGALLIYLAIAKKMEPSLLLPMGFGAILVNLPLSGAITQGDTVGPISALFEAGMSNELFPLLLFIGIGAMIDFGPLLEKPWLMLFGAAAQFGIFFTLFLAGFFFDLKDAASIAVIGAADGHSRGSDHHYPQRALSAKGKKSGQLPAWRGSVRYDPPERNPGRCGREPVCNSLWYSGGNLSEGRWRYGDWNGKSDREKWGDPGTGGGNLEKRRLH